MSKESEDEVAKLLARKLKVKFKNESFPLQEWGRADRWAEIFPNEYLLLEVEKEQRHPCTNVLKVWPYLVEHPEDRIFLVQSFFAKSRRRTSSRRRLSEWTGKKLTKFFPKCFFYCKITVSQDYRTIDEQTLLQKQFRAFFQSKD